MKAPEGHLPTHSGAHMQDPEAIRTAIERNVKAVTLRPGVGQGTARTTARLKPGLECQVTDGPYTLTVGMTEKYGGNDAGPNPGVLGRGALASCMVIDYAVWAARMGIRVDVLEVEVQADYDVRGELGVEGEGGEELRPGYSELRYVVTVESPDPEKRILEWLEKGDRTSPFLDMYANGTTVRREVRIRRPGGGDAGEGTAGEGTAGEGAAPEGAGSGGPS